MANRRMFSMDVIDTDKFLDMPVTTQALYFHLGMRADDDGFISAPKKITKIVNCTTDDLKILISKGYVIPFENGVIVLTHWKKNNYIQSDRYRKTQYSLEASQLTLKDGIYSADTECIHMVSEADTQVRLGKDRLGKDRLGKDSKKNICPEPKSTTPDPSGILLSLVDKTEYDVPLSKIEQWEKAFPAVDVKQELHKMAAWLDANPTRRKTRKGVCRFINSWLSKEQDRGGVYRNGGRQQDTEEEQRRKKQEEETFKFYDDLYSRYPDREPSPDDPFQ